MLGWYPARVPPPRAWAGGGLPREGRLWRGYALRTRELGDHPEAERRAHARGDGPVQELCDRRLLAEAQRPAAFAERHGVLAVGPRPGRARVPGQQVPSREPGRARGKLPA